MSDLVVGLGLVLVIEGLLWAVVPRLATRLLEGASKTSENTLRIAGWSAVGMGLGLVWLIRG